MSREAFYRLSNWLNNPLPANVTAMFAAGIGLLISILLVLMRARFFWFPLHAAGYVVTSNKTMSFFWFSIFLSFAIKYVYLKQGGLRLYRRAIPFFLGLVLGECVATSFGAL